ncbi:MAG TPA: hypothetical protein VK993_00315 [Chthoniobacterales bacterium]|nr:hypothetical protein [Chthoniobacterales bacterium]
MGEVHWGGMMKRKGADPEDGVAVVELTFKDAGKPRSIRFRFEQAADESWKIADISYSDGSTLAGLIKDTYGQGKSGE